MSNADTDTPRYALFPALAFAYYVKDLHTGRRVGDITDRAHARALADILNRTDVADLDAVVATVNANAHA